MLEVRLEPVRGARRARRVGVNAVLAVVGVVLQGLEPSFALTELVIVRRGGPEVVRGDVPTSDRGWLVDQLRRDLRSMTESRFLGRWGDPGRWREALAGR
ncbi:hypothetical protein [Amnibacterium endophyticum]|uniref:Uncharacterized protein n=1 Tax=Amnibacterium endophyticum TaxID=2109337 RepID=A0ABW4LGU3_9MICO